MRVNRNRSSILRNAAMCALMGNPLYANDPAPGAPPAAPPPKPNDPKKIELTEDEIEQRTQSAVNAALEKDRKKRETDAAKEKEERERKEAEEQGKYKELSDKADERRSEAEEKAAAAERRAQLAEVNIELRDYLGSTDELLPYLPNAVDIMVHVEKKLAADAKAEDVTRIIKEEAKAFAERTGKVKKTGLPPEGPSRTPVRPPANPNRPNPNARNSRMPGVASRSF
jgi:hypothetical protein